MERWGDGNSGGERKTGTDILRERGKCDVTVREREGNDKWQGRVIKEWQRHLETILVEEDSTPSFYLFKILLYLVSWLLSSHSCFGHHDAMKYDPGKPVWVIQLWVKSLGRRKSLQHHEDGFHNHINKLFYPFKELPPTVKLRDKHMRHVIGFWKGVLMAPWWWPMLVVLPLLPAG